MHGNGSVLRRCITECKIYAKYVGVVIDPVICFFKYCVKPLSNVCGLYNCQTMPYPRRPFKVETLHHPANNCLTDNKDHAAEMKDHLENIQELDFRFTFNPPTYAGKFDKDVVQMKNKPAYEEQR